MVLRIPILRLAGLVFFIVTMYGLEGWDQVGGVGSVGGSWVGEGTTGG